MTPEQETKLPVAIRDCEERVREALKKGWLPATYLVVDREAKCVELFLDPNTGDYSEWIKGEGADIGLIRSFDSDRVVGVRLPLIHERVVVSTNNGVPVKINEPFYAG